MMVMVVVVVIGVTVVGVVVAVLLWWSYLVTYIILWPEAVRLGELLWIWVHVIVVVAMWNDGSEGSIGCGNASNVVVVVVAGLWQWCW